MDGSRSANCGRPFQGLMMLSESVPSSGIFLSLNVKETRTPNQDTSGGGMWHMAHREGSPGSFKIK